MEILHINANSYVGHTTSTQIFYPDLFDEKTPLNQSFQKLLSLY